MPLVLESGKTAFWGKLQFDRGPVTHIYTSVNYTIVDSDNKGWWGLNIRKRIKYWYSITLQWRHNEGDDVSNHRRHDCLLNRLFRRRSKKTSTSNVTGLYEGNSQVTVWFRSQRTISVKNVSSWWRHHMIIYGMDKGSTLSTFWLNFLVPGTTFC